MATNEPAPRTPRAPEWTDLVILASLLAVAVGAWQLSPWLFVILAGLIVAGVGLYRERRG